ncbi:MAG: PKD domain-containing protein [Defluviitaleaceae bacterium]|nr:PKD domain-containing protein [Defluviitaleaceae bacterium]
MRIIKNLVSFLLIISLFANGLSPFTVLANAGVIEIRTATELDNIRNNLEGHYRLMSSIDLSDMDWVPIGTNAVPFTGTLDGNGFAVLNLEVIAPVRDLVGLFGRTDGVIINLGIINAEITGGFTVGALAGSNRGEIRNCYVAGRSEVFGEGHVGGLIGFNSGLISQSYSTAFVHGGGFVGGFVGSNAGEINRSYSTGTVRTDSSYIGGFTGGMLGEDSKIQNSFTLSTIETNNNDMSAGFIGHIIEGTITNSFSATNNPNGFRYSESSEYIPTHSGLFFDSTLANNNASPEGRTTAQMRNRATFINWDFDNVWAINAGQSYPFLRNMPLPDITPPVIRDVLPRNNEAIGLNPIFRILTEDNASLLSLHAEYELNGEWHEAHSQIILGDDREPIRSFAHRFIWENEGFVPSTVNMRFYSVDLAGNISAYTYMTYDVRNKQLNKPIVSAAPGGMYIDLEITPIPSGATYKLFQIDGVQITLLAELDAIDPLTFTHHHLNPALTYEYFAEATDINGNIVNGEIISSMPVDFDSYAPVAFAGYDFYAVEGVAAQFDGLASSDNIGIVSYSWEIDDGTNTTTISGASPTHTFDDPGDYDISLTVSDAAGNTDTETLTVRVLPASGASSLTLTVIDDATGQRIDGATVFVMLDEANPSFTTSDFSLLTRTGGDGVARLTSSVSGAHSVAVFAPGYMPVERVINFEIGKFTPAEIRLTSGEITIGSMTTREMTLEEIIAAGIDINDPANKHVFSVDVLLVFEGIPLPTKRVITNSRGEILGDGGIDGGWRWGGGGSGGVGGTIYPHAIPVREGQPPILVFLNINGHGHFLKSFFEVSLLQHNMAGERFPLENNSATISLPAGLSLAPAFGGQRSTNAMPAIGGGQSASTKWVVRADSAGTFNITTSFNGQLMPFGEAVSAQFNTNVTVNNSQGLTLYITPQKEAYEGEPYLIDFELKNHSGMTINALTFNFDGTIVEAATLAPGDSVSGTHERIFESGLGRDDLYFRLIDMVIRNARGINVVLNWDAQTYGNLGHNRGNTWWHLIETCVEDPVDLVNGNLTWEYTDFELHGAQNLTFTRYYNSLCEGTTSAGRAWRHSFDYRLVIGVDGARVTLPNGRIYYFVENTDGTFSLFGTTSPDITLTEALGGYLLVLYDNTHVRFDSSWRAVSISDVRGNATTLIYDNTYLIRAENRAGEMHFEYTNGFITKVSDNFGRSVVYEYDYMNRPVIFTNADGDTLVFTYDTESNLTQAANFNGDVYMRNRFLNGQVVEQYLADMGTSRFSYNPVARTTTYTNAVGEVFIYHYNGEYQITSVTERNGSRAQVFDNGHLISSTCQMGHTTEYDYDSNGNKIYVKYPDGTEEFFVYNALRLPTSITHRDGTTETFVYDANGNLTSWTDRAGNTRTFIYDANNNLISLSDANGFTTSFTHDTAGNVTSITDAEGNISHFEYDNLGRRISETRPNGETTRFTYTPAGKLLTITDPLNNVTNLGTDGNGFVTYMTDPMGNTSFMTYDRMNQPVSVTDHEGNQLTRRFDAAGRLIQETDPMGNVTRFDYDGMGRMTRTTDPRGNAWNYSHDASGQLTSITDPNNNTVNLEYDSMGRVKGIRNARGAETTFTHDAMGRVSSVVDALGGITNTEYDVRGNIISITDAEGSTWTFEYDNESRLTKTTDPLNISTTFSYDRLGNLLQSERDGAVHINTFDSNGRLESTTDPGGNTTTFTYDELGRLIEIENADGTSVLFEYNNSGHLTRTTDQAGNSTAYTTDRNGRVITVTDALNNTTSFTYDRNGRILTETDALGGRTSFAYDRNGNIITITDALGNATHLSYDRLNRVERITDPLNNVTRFIYDANNNIIAITDAENFTVNFEYDLLDRLTQTTDQADGVFTSQYDAVGNLITQIDALGNTTSFEYDANHRLTRVTDATGNGNVNFFYDSHDRVIRIVDQENAETVYSYDDNGRVIRITDALCNATEIEYDSMNRVIRTLDPLNNETHFTYTATGLLQTVTDDLGETTTFEYNALGQLISETNSNGESTTFTRDALGRITGVTNALNHTETFTYDRLGRIIAVTDRNGKTTSYQHDANGNIIEATDPSGNVSIFTYDRLNRLTRANVNGGQITLYTYDGRGLLTREVNALGDAKVFVYDANGNLISQTDEDGYVTTYDYNLLNLIERINHSDGRSASFRYDKTGRLVEVDDWTGTTNFTLDLLGRITQVTDSNNRTVSYAYDANGNQTVITYPDSTTVSRTFDSLNRLTSIQTPEGTFNYSHDSVGRITSLVYPNGITESYSHDAIGQLLTISQTHNGITELLNIYTYDAVGNIITRTSEFEGNIAGSVTSNTYNNFNQLITQTVYNLRGEETARLEFTYDKRGNQTRETDTINNTSQSYTFNAQNRMVHGENHNGETSSYTYNALNILTQKETITATSHSVTELVTDYTSFVPTILYEYHNDNTTRRHIYGNAGFGLSRISTTLSVPTVPSETFYIQSDRLGSSVRATDITGNLVGITVFDEWGRQLQKVIPTFNGVEVDILNMFTNHTYDEIVGVYQTPARFYDASQRRFISPDSYWTHANRIYGTNNFIPCLDSIVQANNLYSYTGNNPLRYTDPTGRNRVLPLQLANDQRIYLRGLQQEQERQLILMHQGQTHTSMYREQQAEMQAMHRRHYEALLERQVTPNVSLHNYNALQNQQLQEMQLMQRGHFFEVNPQLTRLSNELQQLQNNQLDFQQFMHMMYFTMYVCQNPYDVNAWQNYINNLFISSFVTVLNFTPIGDLISLGEIFNILTNWEGTSEQYAALALNGISLVPYVPSAVSSVRSAGRTGRAVSSVADTATPLARTARGVGTLADGTRMTTNQALDAASDFLGRGYREIAPGVFRSSDGLRQVRMTNADVLGRHAGAPHMNFEIGTTVNRNGRLVFERSENMHIFFTD